MQLALLACNGFAPMTLPATPMATRMQQMEQEYKQLRGKVTNKPR